MAALHSAGSFLAARRGLARRRTSRRARRAPACALALALLLIPAPPATADALSGLGVTVAAPPAARWRHYRFQGAEWYQNTFEAPRQIIRFEVRFFHADTLVDGLDALDAYVRRRMHFDRTEADRSFGPPLLRCESTVAEDPTKPPHKRERQRTIAYFFAHPSAPVVVASISYTWILKAGAEPVPLEAEDGSPLRSITAQPSDALLDRCVPAVTTPQVVAAGHGSLWITQTASNSVSRVDPATGRRLASIPVGFQPVGIATTPTAVWVANLESASLTEIDPATNGVRSTTRLGVHPLIIAAVDDTLWITSQQDFTLCRFEPASRRLVSGALRWESERGIARAGKSLGRYLRSNLLEPPDRYEPRVACTGVCALGPRLFITEHRRGVVMEVDRRTLEIVTIWKVGASADMMTAANGALWVTVQNGDEIVRLNPDSSAVTSRVPVGHQPGGVTFAHGLIWVSNFGSDTVSRVDPATSRVVGTPVRTGAQPQGLQADETGVWVANLGNASIAHLHP